MDLDSDSDGSIFSSSSKRFDMHLDHDCFDRFCSFNAQACVAPWMGSSLDANVNVLGMEVKSSSSEDGYGADAAWSAGGGVVSAGVSTAGPNIPVDDRGSEPQHKQGGAVYGADAAGSVGGGAGSAGVCTADPNKLKHSQGGQGWQDWSASVSTADPKQTRMGAAPMTELKAWRSILAAPRRQKLQETMLATVAG